MKITTPFFFFLCCILQLSAQSNHNKDHQKKWILSFSADKSFEAPGKTIVKAMKDSGFGDRTPLVTHAGYYDYYSGILEFVPAYTTGGERSPIRNGSKSSISIQGRYNLNQRTAFEIKYGNHWNESIQGYDAHQEKGNFLTLTTEAKILSASYMQLMGNRGTGFSIGPSLAFHQVSGYSAGLDAPNLHKAVKPGIHTGFDLSLIKSKLFYLGFNLQYNWFPMDEIRPFSVEKAYEDSHQNPTIFTSVFDKTKIRLSNLNFGVTGGIKF